MAVVTPLPTSGLPMSDLTEKSAASLDGTENIIMYDANSAKSVKLESIKTYTLNGQAATAAIITMTYDAHDDWTCDTTFDDVMAYITDGRVVLCKLENFDIDGNVYDDVYLPLAHYDSTLVEFEGIYQQYDLYAQLADDDSVSEVGFGYLPTSTEIPPIVETVIQGIGYAESLYF